MRLELVKGDITQERVDAIVNAANSALAGGGGVDGAIHRAGGPGIMEELRRRYEGCPTGGAVVTGGGALPCRWVIHAVGPVWRGGGHGEDELLASAYRAALDRAREVGARTLALPSLSTGAYGFPVERAAPLALATVRAHGAGIELARFVLFSDADLAVYERALGR